MAQDITKISPEFLQLELHKLDLFLIKQLFEGLSNYLTEKGNGISHVELLQQERKRTMLLREMKIRMPRNKMPVEFGQWEKNIYNRTRKKYNGFGYKSK